MTITASSVIDTTDQQTCQQSYFSVQKPQTESSWEQWMPSRWEVTFPSRIQIQPRDRPWGKLAATAPTPHTGEWIKSFSLWGGHICTPTTSYNNKQIFFSLFILCAQTRSTWLAKNLEIFLKTLLHCRLVNRNLCSLLGSVGLSSMWLALMLVFH